MGAMENLVMNIFGVIAILAMLYAIYIMWRNINRELEKIDTPRKASVKIEKEQRLGLNPSCSSVKCYINRNTISIPDYHL